MVQLHPTSDGACSGSEVVEMVQPHPTSDGACSGSEVVEMVQPHSTSDGACSGSEVVEMVQPHPTSDGAYNGSEVVETVQPCSANQTTCLPSALSSAGQHMMDTESSDHVAASCANSEHAFVSVGGNCLVSESSSINLSSQNGVVEPLTSSQPYADRSILMTNALSTSTPLDVDESTATRVVPTSSACIVNMEQQFAVSSTHGEYVSTLLRRGQVTGVRWPARRDIVFSVRRWPSIDSGDSQHIGTLSLLSRDGPISTLEIAST